MADLREQLLELRDGEVCVGECVWIRRPVSYFLGHTGKDIPNLLAQFHRKLLRGTWLTLVRVNFVERPVVSGLGDCQSQGYLASRITCIWFLKVIFMIVKNYIETLRNKGDVRRRV